MMYSPPTGGAARRVSAIMDKQHTSKRRFIICGEEEYLCGARNSQVVGRGRRACRVWAAFPTGVHLLLRAQGLPTFAASGSARTYPREPALRRVAGANCSSTP